MIEFYNKHNVKPSLASKCSICSMWVICECPNLQDSVNIQLQELCGHSVRRQSLCSTPAHFYVLCGLLPECPPEPRSKRVVTATAPRVAVLSIPKGVVGVPLKD